MMEPLTREQVEEQCKNVVYASNGDEGTYAAMNQLQYTDAALRAQLTAMTEERDELFVRHTNQKKSIERYQQEIARLKTSSVPLEEHNRIVEQTITAMDAERVSFEQEIARLTVVLLRYVRGQQTGSDGVYCSQLMAHEGTKEGG